MNMDGVQAQALHQQAQELLANGAPEAQRQFAVKISDFLHANGEDLDREGYSSTVDNLGKDVDELVKGAGPAQFQSSVLTGIEAFVKDDSSLDQYVSKQIDDYIDAGNKKAKRLLGPWKWWLIGGGVLATTFVVAYTVKAVKL